jgi:hypothetical protein
MSKKLIIVCDKCMAYLSSCFCTSFFEQVLFPTTPVVSCEFDDFIFELTCVETCFNWTLLFVLGTSRGLDTGFTLITEGTFSLDTVASF